MKNVWYNTKKVKPSFNACNALIKYMNEVYKIYLKKTKKVRNEKSH